ncbi:MAG: hypothetical protein QOH96_1980, partial [Blastocatellia bacterium]|nr:hypothetical protein [Blastocatellia bacterium]
NKTVHQRHAHAPVHFNDEGDEILSQFCSKLLYLAIFIVNNINIPRL